MEKITQFQLTSNAFKNLLKCFFFFNARIRVVPMAVSTHEIKQVHTEDDPVGLMSRDLDPPPLQQLVSPLNHTCYSCSIFIYIYKCGDFPGCGCLSDLCQV